MFSISAKNGFRSNLSMNAKQPAIKNVTKAIIIPSSSSIFYLTGMEESILVDTSKEIR